MPATMPTPPAPCLGQMSARPHAGAPRHSSKTRTGVPGDGGVQDPTQEGRLMSHSPADERAEVDAGPVDLFHQVIQLLPGGVVEPTPRAGPAAAGIDDAWTVAALHFDSD